MAETPRRGVTRGYVGGVIAAVAVLALALVVASWGGLSVLIGRDPVTTEGVWRPAAELLVALALAVLIWAMWLATLTLLRGRRGPAWSCVIVPAACAYLVWSCGGMLFGLSIAETWLSPFALALAVIWAVCALVFWAMLVRRVYTDRPVPRWPWEKRGEPGPDWVAPSEPKSDDDFEGGER